MKHFFTLIVTCLLLSSFFLVGGIEEIITALKEGNAGQIAKYFDNTVEITLPGKSNNYPKAQGETVLKDFFNNSPVKSFEILHKGENSGSQFCIGTFVNSSGTYRVTIFMKQKADRQMIQEIRFENK